MKSLHKNKIKIFALGGLGEIGKNTYILEYDNEIIIIDAGIKFPENELFGIDYVIPDYSYLEENRHKIKGLFITHGHEDHIGGIPFLLKNDITIPIYAGSLACALIQERLKEHGLLRQANIKEIQEETVISFDHFSIGFFRTNHSIPDSYGIVVDTPHGNIVHTGDFKFDLTPIGPPANLTKIATIGQEGVLCLLSDSTNSEIPGFSVSESVISETVKDLFSQVTGKVIFATFASNIFRIKQAIEAAISNNRKVIVLGRSLERSVRIGQELGYITLPPGTLIDLTDIKKWPADEIAIICTGSQGEPFAALSRIANNRQRHVTIEPSDTVIFSSSPIPGNTLSINKIINQLSRLGATVIHHKLKEIHTSGHGAQEELKLMLRLINPKFFIPIHGEYKMLKKHTELANQCGIPYERSFILDNGHILELDAEEASRGDIINANEVYVDGEGIGDVGNIVLRDRRILSESGILLVIVTIDKKANVIVSGPEIITRGFVFMKESTTLLTSLASIVEQRVNHFLQNGEKQRSDRKKAIIDSVQPYIYKETKRRPMVIPIIMEI